MNAEPPLQGRPIYAALLHHPVLDRAGHVVTTAITNLDLHDISRSARSYGLQQLFVAHPVEAQRALATRIREHWVNGSGKLRIPDRATAMECVTIVESLEALLAVLGGSAELWVTSAKGSSGAIDYSQARQMLARSGPPVVLLFGTGWGLAEEIMERARFRLSPIKARGGDGYNHLSVRAAAAITFDRLLG